MEGFPSVSAARVAKKTAIASGRFPPSQSPRTLLYLPLSTCISIIYFFSFPRQIDCDVTRTPGTIARSSVCRLFYRIFTPPRVPLLARLPRRVSGQERRPDRTRTNDPSRPASFRTSCTLFRSFYGCVRVKGGDRLKACPAETPWRVYFEKSCTDFS